jgi:hypothetical protein
VFEEHGIYLQRADLDRINGGRAVRRAFQLRPSGEYLPDGTAVQVGSLYVVDTPGNRRVWDQLANTLPDPNRIEEPLKVDSDAEGRGGDDGADALRYGVATRLGTPKDPTPGEEVRAIRRGLDPLSRTEADDFDELLVKAQRRRVS